MCKRFYAFSRDPYVRAHYFLSRYGSVQALYWALGRGQLITDQVLDVSALIRRSPHICRGFYLRDQVLLSSGAHLSRYLVQVAAHHYFRSLCPFIKTPWVRTLSLSTFGHFLKQSSERFESINIAKGEDDGAVFRTFIRDCKRHPDRRGLATDVIAEMLEKGKVSLFKGFRSMPSKIATHSSSHFVPRCVPLNPAESHSIYTIIIGPNHGPVSPGALYRTTPSPAGHRKWVPYGQSSAHFLLVVVRFNAHRRHVGSVPRLCVPQNLCAIPGAWSGGRPPECPRTLSFGSIVCASGIGFFVGSLNTP